mgnify:CR=1 FL=1
MLKAVVNVLLAIVFSETAVIVPAVSSSPNVDVVGPAVRASTQVLPRADQRGPAKINRESLGVVTDAPTVLVRDVRSGVALVQQDAGVRRPIASITKLMTAIVLVEDYTWSSTDAATVLREDVRSGGRWYFRFSDEITMGDLFSVMLVASGNNETMALVRSVGASEDEFVAKMNAKAAALGMRDTSFADLIGLSAENTSTAQDVMVMMRRALSHDEIAVRVHLPTVNVTSALGYTYAIEGTNELLGSLLNQSPYRIVGGKTGSTDEAGYCLATRVAQGDVELDIVVLGARQPNGRFEDVKDIVSWAFDVYRWN